MEIIGIVIGILGLLLSAIRLGYDISKDIHDNRDSEKKQKK